MANQRKLEVRSQIITCTACQLHTKCKAPVPFRGPIPPDYIVVGEAPGEQEDAEGKPFVGPAGQILMTLLKSAGLDPERALFINTVSCYPVDFEGKGRTPSASEVKACADNLTAQLEVAQCNFILATGRVPLDALRPGLKISKAHGHPIMLGSTREEVSSIFLMPTFHPSYVLRTGGEGSSSADAVVKDMVKLRKALEGANYLELTSDLCLECVEEATRWTVDGLGYCKEHWT